MTPAEWRRAAVIAALHVVGFFVLLALVVPHDLRLGSGPVFGPRLGDHRLYAGHASRVRRRSHRGDRRSRHRAGRLSSLNPERPWSGRAERIHEIGDEPLDALEASGLRVLVPERLPPNDGGVSYGQVAVGAARGTA